MPYKIKGKCIYKKDTGAKVGCTKGDVHKYMAALQMHAHESEIKDLNEVRAFVRNVLSEIEMNKTLYHGTPYEFRQFKNRTTFFADNPKFAVEYAYTKAQDAALDNDISLVTVELTGNIFDPHNPDDFARMQAAMPDKVEVPHGVWAFFTKDFDKQEMLKRIRGIGTAQPIQSMVDAKIGDEVPDPSYDKEKLVVVGKNENYAYTIPKNRIDDYVNSSAMGHNEHFSHYAKYKDYFNEWRKAIVDLYNQKMNSTYDYPKYGFNKFYQTYVYATKHRGIGYDFVNPYRRDDKKFDVTPEEEKKLDSMYEEAKNKLIPVLMKDLDKSFWAIRPVEEPLDNTWTYLENNTVLEVIKNMGYDGYVAKEDGHNTYAIFNPQKSVRILKIERA